MLRTNLLQQIQHPLPLLSVSASARHPANHFSTVLAVLQEFQGALPTGSSRRSAGNCDESVFARLELVALHLIEESQHLIPSLSSFAACNGRVIALGICNPRLPSLRQKLQSMIPLGATTGPDGGGVGLVLRSGGIALPQPEETQGLFRFSALFTSRDHFTKGFSIRLKSSLPHGGHELKSTSPLTCLAGSAHSSIQGSGIGLQSTTPHFLQKLKLLTPSGSVAGADRSIASVRSWRMSVLQHRPMHPQRLCALSSISADVHYSCVADDINNLRLAHVLEKYKGIFPSASLFVGTQRCIT